MVRLIESFPAGNPQHAVVYQVFGALMCASLTKQKRLPAHHTQPACTTPHTTLTTSTHNPPIMASSSSASDWECGACASSNKGASTALCVILPTKSARQYLSHLRQMLLCPQQLFLRQRHWQRRIPLRQCPGQSLGHPRQSLLHRGCCFRCCCHCHCVFAAVFSCAISLLLNLGGSTMRIEHAVFR